MTDPVHRYLAKADQALRAAEALARDEFYSEAASRAYYAMFYAAQALLISEGVEVIKHSAVEAEFGRRFAKTGRLDSLLHRKLINARKTREIADYDIEDDIEETMAVARIEDGKVLVRAIKEFLFAAISTDST